MLPTVSRQVRERYKIDEQEKKKTFQETYNRVDFALKKLNDVVITDNWGSKSGGKNKCATKFRK